MAKKKQDELQENELVAPTGEVFKNKPKERILVSGATFHNFNLNKEFSGNFLRPVLREVDSSDGSQKAGSVMGYLFVDDNGEEFIIGNATAIEKAITQNNIKEGDYLRIVYLGQIDTKKGKRFNRFHVSIIEI